MDVKTVEIEADDWDIADYRVWVKCPYCGEEDSLHESDPFGETVSNTCLYCEKEYEVYTSEY